MSSMRDAASEAITEETFSMNIHKLFATYDNDRAICSKRISVKAITELNDEAELM